MKDINIKFLQRLCESYKSDSSLLSSQFKFKSNFISRNFKFSDYCSQYSIIVLSDGSFKGCLHSPALFTLINQEFDKHELGVSYINTLILTVKCEYINTGGLLCSYIFKINLESNSSQNEYITHLSVNINGLCLILYSQSQCYIANTPFEISDYYFDGSNNSCIFLKNPITGKLLLKEHFSNSVDIVKSLWNPIHSNSFVIVTNESLFERESGREDNVLNLSQKKYYSFVRIFNLDDGLDHPVYEFKLSEQMCRIGNENEPSSHAKFQSNRGTLVDFFWNCRDSSVFGSSSVFVLSNYGFVFCYCPVVINYMYDLNKNIPMVRKTLELMKSGFIFEFDNKSDSRSNDIQTLVSNMNNSLFNPKSPATLYPIIIRLLNDEFIPDSKFNYSYPTFCSFLLLSTDPLLILASQDNSTLLLFKPTVQIHPQNSKFYNIKTLFSVNECRFSQFLQFNLNSRLELLFLSHSNCLYYSPNKCYHLYMDDKLCFKTLLESDDNEYLIFSNPLLIKSYSSNNLVEQPFSIIITHQYEFVEYMYLEFKKLLVFKLSHLSSSKVTSDVSLDSINSMGFNSFDSKVTEIIRPNNVLFVKIKRCREMLNGYKERFELMRKSNDSKDLNSKAIDLINNLSKLHSDVIVNLQCSDIYSKAIDDYVRMNDEASTFIDNYFNDTLDHYHTMFNEINKRIENIMKMREYISIRRREIQKMVNLVENYKNMENCLGFVSNLITDFYLKISRLILNKVKENMNKNDYSFDFESRKQLMIDEWFYDTFKTNVDLMHKIFNKIKTIKTAIYTMY